MNPKIWASVEDVGSEKLAGHEIQSIKMGKLFHWWTGRNAWHGVWSQKYEGAHAFKLSREEAESTAERLRTCGTKFYIQEFPVIVVLSNNLNMFIGEINSNTPLKSFQEISGKPETLLEIARLFQPKTQHTVARILSNETPVVVDDTEKFRAFKSYSTGSRYFLSYGRETEWDLSGTYVSQLAQSLRITTNSATPS